MSLKKFWINESFLQYLINASNLPRRAMLSQMESLFQNVSILFLSNLELSSFLLDLKH